MKKLLLLLIFVPVTVVSALAQGKYFTRSGKIFFKCTKSSIEKIEATNKSTTAVLDIKTGQFQFAVLMKGFEFERALMQEHFNENYVESEKFPKAEFKGQVINYAEVAFDKDGTYPVKVKGILTIHGVSKEMETAGIIQVKQGKLLTKADFILLLSDYNISIPSLVSDKISNTVNISVDCLLEPLGK
jgi:hypothetical protein